MNELERVTQKALEYSDQLYERDMRVAHLEDALRLIAAPKRPDGTYNRCREACEILAREALEGQK